MQLLNNITDPSLIFVGQEIRLPGDDGESLATVRVVQLGDSLDTLAAQYRTSAVEIAAQNLMISANNLVVGRSIVVNSKTGSSEPETFLGEAHVVELGESLLTIAAQHRLSPAAIIDANDLPYPNYLIPGQRLRIPSQDSFQYLSAGWQKVSMGPLPLTPGSTAAIFVKSGQLIAPIGEFLDQKLQFTSYEDGFIALVGLDAFAEPGAYDIALNDATDEIGVALYQQVLVEPGAFITQFITIPQDKVFLLDPEIRSSEDEFLAATYSSFTDEQLWDGLFQSPISNTIVTAPYGDARSYNGGPVEIFHTGVDFGGAIGTEIRAPAAGTVVFSDTLALRGNTVIIDHGLGVMTGYYHLSKILALVGEPVSVGQIVGEGGSSGLSTGPHLHWDLRILNVPVNPMLWLIEDILDSQALGSNFESDTGVP